MNAWNRNGGGIFLGCVSEAMLIVEDEVCDNLRQQVAIKHASTPGFSVCSTAGLIPSNRVKHVKP